MHESIQPVAEAFCRHRFDDALPHLADDVVWEAFGRPPLTGRDAVAAACAESTRELEGVTTTFTRFSSIDAGDVVIVESLADYTEPDGERSVVASCDVFESSDGRVTAIRSYTVAVD